MKVNPEPKNTSFNRSASFPGTIQSPIRLKNSRAFLEINNGPPAGHISYKRGGLVAAFNGGGDEPDGDEAYRDAGLFAAKIASAGGIILNGGRNSGIMLATGQAAGKNCVGVNFPEQVKKGIAHTFGTRLVADSPATRLALLTQIPPVVLVYGGQIGTLHELVNALTGIKNRALYNLTAPALYVQETWNKPLAYLVSSGILAKKYFDEIVFFTDHAAVFGLLQP